MYNRATNVFSEQTPQRGSADRPWQVDENPGLRLSWLFVFISLPILAIVVRLAHLQVFLTDVYVDSLDVTTVEYEPIDSRDGRIVSQDGRVLAYDQERFQITMHYRWLEDPPNEVWLKQQALATLSRADRRNPERVEAAKNEVLQRRALLARDLAALANISPEQLNAARKRVQERVERVVARMRRIREERLNAQAGSADAPVEPDAPWWSAAWNAVVTAVTTPPRRDNNDPLVAREELDYHVVLEDVPLSVRAEIESRPKRFPGLRIATATRRVYPASGIAPHVVGTRLPLTHEEIESRREKLHGADPLDYQQGDRMGRSGLERSYDAHLRGLRGERKIVRNRYREVIAEEIVRPPRSGNDVELTLHLPLQEEMESLLDDVLSGENRPVPNENAESTEPLALVPDGASLVAVDVQTGAVLVAASAPRFDLGLFATPDAETWQRIQSDSRRPMFHRAIQMTLPPGSVFKPLTSVAMIESGRIDPDRRIFCQGYLDRPDRHRCYVFNHFGIGHGDTNLSDALCHSCNVYFFEGARKIGPEPIVTWADRFGFGHPTGIDLPSESRGNVPSPRQTGAGTGRNSTWYPGDTLGLAIGQSRLMVTPLQVARLMATIANGGYLVTPHVGKASLMEGSQRATVDAVAERRRLPELSDVTLERIREGLERVVADPSGTGHKTVFMEEIAIAGKTGTAEVGGGRPDHAWFAGYVPADRPRIAFAVVLEHAGSGGKAAGPVAKRFVEALLGHGILQPTRLVVHEERESTKGN